MTIVIRQAMSSDSDTVAELVHGLLCELSGLPAHSIDLHDLVKAADGLVDQDRGVWAFLASNEHEHDIGVLTLNEGAAIYAGGKLGTISEFYVRPESRSDGVGPQLLEAAITLGRERNWGRLEVGAPSVPRWSRTVGFYLKNGFEEVGPRLKLRL